MWTHTVLCGITFVAGSELGAQGYAQLHCNLLTENGLYVGGRFTLGSLLVCQCACSVCKTLNLANTETHT